ncbi:MAG TPA: bifunctional 5,10-methylene-tetrahydrofolate dehydrogenase/5,10-methylene-tetrahydrofolate cyclohydrolase, partial [Candidatus Dorea intestinavium]|nr:bifunctional 5,10-methylene-tetrahydrofolate dehydrogenase/5,10-methylene-tetrahydrofolate cyclohydrolase [Candidatus Dorea intestinavium]
MAIIMKGMETANAKKDEMIKRVKALEEKSITPCLGIIRVGDKPEDLAYERGATKRLNSVGVETKVIKLPLAVTQDMLEALLKELNEDEKVQGILIFQPLPEHLDLEQLKSMISPQKDVDGLSNENLGKVLTGDELGFAPCTPEGVLWMLDYYQIDLTGKDVTIVGRSSVVGKPLALLLTRRNATVTLCHTKTKNLAEKTKRADIIVACAGQKEMITEEMVKAGAVVVDVGINVNEEGKLCGDVAFAEV